MVEIYVCIIEPALKSNMLYRKEKRKENEDDEEKANRQNI